MLSGGQTVSLVARPCGENKTAEVKEYGDLTSARGRREAVLRFAESHPLQEKSAGFASFASADCRKAALAWVAFTGRGGTPADILCGMQLSAAEAASEDWLAAVASAHGESQYRALEWLCKSGAEQAIIIGHSHGGDHASMLAAEYRRCANRPVAVLTGYPCRRWQGGRVDNPYDHCEDLFLHGDFARWRRQLQETQK